MTSVESSIKRTCWTGDQRHIYAKEVPHRNMSKVRENWINDLNLVEEQFVPETVVAYNPAGELRLFSPHGVVKQSPSQWGVDRAQDL